jgi:hypothetical protein
MPKVKGSARVWGPLQEEMGDALEVVPTDVPGVLATLTRLQDILKRLPPVEERNPVAIFNTLYTRVTACVLADLNRCRFEDPDFMERLDVEFAARYFVALRRFTGMDPSGRTPAAWTVLFKRRGDRAVRAIPAAAVGVNAHVNFDLTFALLETLAALRLTPVDGSRQHKDYLHINEIFRQQIPILRDQFQTDLARVVDRLNGKLDDWTEGWLVVETRDLAWRRAKRLWRKRGNLRRRQWVETRMDRQAAFLGRFLLSLCWLQ